MLLISVPGLSRTHLSELPLLLLLRFSGLERILEAPLHLHASRLIGCWKWSRCGRLAFDWIARQLDLADALSCSIISSFLLPRRKHRMTKRNQSQTATDQSR